LVELLYGTTKLLVIYPTSTTFCIQRCILQVLYDQLKLDQHLSKNTLYRTAKGQEMSTSEGMLKQLVPYHPLPSVILKHRQVYLLELS